MEDLTKKYRPSRLEDVIGQPQVVRSIKQAIASKRSRTFLFTGPSGVGKTTLARIVAEQLGCTDHNLLEIDAATHSGVEDMRQLTEFVRYRPLAGASRAIVVDEAHQLSKQAWQALLKSTEEPPEHAVWIFCTTEVSKVPKTIQTRCLWYGLKPVSDDELLGLVEGVNKTEKIGATEKMLGMVVRGAEGSVRRALQLLAQAEGVKDAAALQELIEHAVPETNVIDFCRTLYRQDWDRSIAALARLTDTGIEAESIRIVVLVYFAKVVANEKSEGKRRNFLQLMEYFGTPCHPGEKHAPLVMALGRYVYG